MGELYPAGGRGGGAPIGGGAMGLVTMLFAADDVA